MALDTTKSWQEFTADGQTAFFTFNFNYITDRPQDIIVGKRIAENTYEIIEPSNYQLVPNASGSGGVVRLIKYVMVGNEETIQDDIPTAGTVIRIARKSLDTSNAKWQIGLNMTEMVNLFDRLFRLTQENKGRFANTIKTFATQHGVKLYELLSAHQNTLLYWDNETKTLTPTEFPKSEIVRCVGGLFFRIQKNTATNTDYLLWSRDAEHWTSIDISGMQAEIDEIADIANRAIDTATNAESISREAKQIANDAKETAEGIDDKAQQALDNSEEAIETAEEAKNMIQNQIIIRSETIPTASADLLGKAYQYTGQTSGTYEHGYIYECVAAQTTYTGIIGFEPAKIAFDYTAGDMVSFFSEITPDFAQITHGTFTYDIAGNIWTIVGKDSNENVVFDNYKLYTEDLEDAGFVFINPAQDYADGEVIDFTTVFTPEYNNFGWERIDVQPGGSRGRFLALWDCTTGLAESNPPISPYEYKTGDYFIVSVVGATNYKPDGTEYVIGTASTTVETNEVAIDDVYFYDGTQWKLQSNSNKTVAFSAIAGSPYDNTNLASALNTKQDTLTAGANIQINGSTISATDTTYTAGTGIDITGGVISNTQTSAEWGNITGDIADQTDLQNALAAAGTPDGTTITRNSNNQLQANGVLNQNTATGATNPVYDWVGTLAEYQAQNIETLHPDWICYITDDVSGGATVYTKAEVDTIASGKANVALDNLTSAGKEVCANMSMPSSRYVALTLGASGSSYTAPADGWLSIHITQAADNTYFNVYVYYNGVEMYALTLHAGSLIGYNQGDIIPIPKGARVSFVYNGSPTVNYIRFIYANGAQ